MKKNNLILISVNASYIRIAQIKQGVLSDFHLENLSYPSEVGAIYKAQVIKKQTGLGACFVNMSKNVSGFLYIKPDQKKTQKEETFLPPEDIKKDIEKSDNPLKEGQKLMVQVVKDPLKGKNFRVTDKISLPGTYLVYLPNLPTHIRISRKIEEEEIKKKLTCYVQKWGENKSFIIRTRAKKVSEKELKQHFGNLKNTWASILKKYQSQKKPGLIWSDVPLYLQILRDALTEQIDQVLVDDRKLFTKIRDFVNKEIPKEKHKLTFYKEKNRSLFESYNLEAKLKSLLSKKVSLSSGGFIVIEETEAAVVIDVNTGRFIGDKTPEENILDINKEAVKEIALQLRLRNCGGIVLIDFIDMERENSCKEVMELLTEELKKDTAPTRLLPMSEFGVVQLTRKRNRASLLEELSGPCPQCGHYSYIEKNKKIF